MLCCKTAQKYHYIKFLSRNFYNLRYRSSPVTNEGHLGHVEETDRIKRRARLLVTCAIRMPMAASFPTSIRGVLSTAVRPTLSMLFETHNQTETFEANLLARTRLKAPMSLEFAPSDEAITLAEGKPRQMLFSSTALFRC